MCAGGFLAPLFLTVTGQSEQELPLATCPDGVLIMEVPGLCVGGTVDPRNCNVGYVALIRGKPDDAMLKVESPEKDVFRCYRKNVLLPWITEIRRTVHNLSEGAPVPDELSAVSWLDGGMPQLAVVVREEMQDADKLLKICTCKHAAAATGTQQPCDLCAAFRTMKDC